ncbi:MAG: glycosyltransferase family 4 protein [Dehalococcoidia bacterium]
MRFVQVNDIASVASELAAALRKRGHEVDLFYPTLYGSSLPPLGKLLVSPLRFIEWVKLARRVRAGHYDAVHIHYAYLGIVGLLARVSYVLHCHGDDVRDVERRIWAPLIRLSIRRARHVYYSTPDLREPLLKIRPDAEFLPNPIDIEHFRPRPLPEDAEDILIACALSENKGVEHILGACEILAERRPRTRIDAFSGGTATARANQLPNLLLLLHQPRPKLAELMSRHRVIIGQVHEGAVGMVELEALACGRPVVSRFTYNTAYEEPPPFVNASNAVEIAEAAISLLEDPAESAKLGAAGRAWVERNHNAAIIAERIETLAIENCR